MKYLFIDTNNFMACALLTEADQTPQTIDLLINLLSKNQTKLILPEIIEIEFFREVDLELLKTRKFVENLKSQLGTTFPTYLMPDKDQYIKSARQIYSKRKSSSQAAKAKIRSLFSLNSVIRIPLSYEIFIKAYTRAMSGQKPSKTTYCPECGEIRQRLDDDCMVFESILSMKGALENSELIFCSANTKHFASYDKERRKYFLHPELLSSFSQRTVVKYYLKLADVLNAEFRKDIAKEEKERINTYFETQESARRIGEFAAQLREQMSLPASLLMQGIAKQIAEVNVGIAEKIKTLYKGSLTGMFRQSQIDPLRDALRAVMTPTWLITQTQFADELNKLTKGWQESVKKIALTGSKEAKKKNEKK